MIEAAEVIREPGKKEVLAMTREAFLAGVSADKPQPFDVPNLGRVMVKPLSVKQREAIKSGSAKFPGGPIDDAKFLSLTLVHGITDPVLQPPDVAALLEANFGAVSIISARIWSVSGVGPEAAQEAKNG